MAAKVETMAYAGALPWHGLGVEVDEDTTPDDMLIKAGLDWETEMRPIRLVDGKVIKDRAAVVRKTDDTVYGICGTRFKPVQNAKIMDFFTKFVDAGHMKMHTAGSLVNGKFVWALAKVGDSFTVGREDKVEGYLLLMNSHEPGRSLIIQHTSVRVVCWNTLSAALGSGLKGSEGAFRMSHTIEFDDTVRSKAEQALGLSHEHLERFAETADILSQKRCSDEAARNYFMDVFNVRAQVEAAVANDDKRPPRIIKNAMEAFATSPGAELPGTKGTYWGALNAVTFLSDHKIGRSADTRMRESWFGARARTKAKAVELALAA